MECVLTTVKFLLKLLRRRDSHISLKHKPIPLNCASSIFKTKAFPSCYTDVIFNMRFKEVIFALHDICSQSFVSKKQTNRNEVKKW